MRGWARVGNVHGPHGFVDLDSFIGWAVAAIVAVPVSASDAAAIAVVIKVFMAHSSSLVKAEKTPERHQG